MAKYNADGSLQQALDDGNLDGADLAPAPWYRNRVLLALWALAVALLLTVIIYGLVELSRGGGGGPSTPHSSPHHPRSSTTSTTTTTTPSTTTEAPPPETPVQTPEEAPPANSPAPAEPPHHHHHLPHVPSTITLPHTVVTLPHGF
jgi:hypothetical protein